MQYMLIHCVSEGIELSPDHAVEVEASLSSWIEETLRDGVNLHGARLQPARDARTVAGARRGGARCRRLAGLLPVLRTSG